MMSVMLKSLAGVTYRVPDLQKAKDWYGQFFDQPAILDSPFVVVFRAGDSTLNLVPAADSMPGSEERVVAYWNVEDIDAAYRRLLDAGAASESEITTTVLRTKMARLADPFGNALGLMSRASEAKQNKSLEEQPSDSAMGVALSRALAAGDAREEIRGPDYLAEAFLSADARRSLKDAAAREWIRKKLGAEAPGSYEYFIARTGYLDGVVRQALEKGTPQLVFLGAGYDSRSYRFQDLIRGTRIFELDIEPTQQRKRRTLEQAGIAIPPQLTFVSIDFTRDRLEDALEASGYDKKLKTLFVWEGVMYYLPAEAVDRTLEFVRSNSPAGSVLCFDYLAAAPDMADRYGVKESRAIMRAMYRAEQVQFSIPEGAVEAFLSERGFRLIDHLTPEAMEQRYLTLRDGSLAGKVLACFRLARAAVVQGTIACSPPAAVYPAGDGRNTLSPSSASVPSAITAPCGSLNDLGLDTSSSSFLWCGARRCIISQMM
jgi:methyltransferase (TIGR00027 family)